MAGGGEMTPKEAKEMEEKYMAVAKFYAAKAEGKELQILFKRTSEGETFSVWATTDTVPTIQCDLSMWRVRENPRKAWSVGSVLSEDESMAKLWTENGQTVTQWQEVLP